MRITGWKKWLLIFLFLAGFGFAGGGSFLLFALVPLERSLVTRGWTQPGIDRTLSFFVYGWFVFSFLLTALYWRLTLAKGRLRAAGTLALVMLVAAGFVFYEFMHPKTGMIAGSRGQIDQASDQLTFGPYPDAPLLTDLKRQRYDGVISILHPAIPFEKILLDEEKKNGAELGIQIYSVPMLPWISGDKEQLATIAKLLQQPGKRYYVHCYLGEHRVNLVKRMAGLGTFKRGRAPRAGWHPGVPGDPPGFGVGRELAPDQVALVTTMLDNFSLLGVESDGKPTYEEGQGGVHSYFGAFGTDLDLVTYKSGRRLHFTFDPKSKAFRASGIGRRAGSEFLAESDFSGLSLGGRYRDMGGRTTAQVHLALRFYVGGATYNLDYPSLVVHHKTADTWLITTDPVDTPGFPASPVAELTMIGERSITSFGTVNMPMRFEVTLKSASPNKSTSGLALGISLYDSVVDEHNTTGFYKKGIPYCSGSSVPLGPAAFSGGGVVAGPTEAYDFASSWTTATGLSSTLYSDNADCGPSCVRAQLSTDFKVLSLDTRGTSPVRALKLDFTLPCTEPGCPPAGSPTVFGGHLTTPGLLNVTLTSPFISMAVCSSATCPEAQPTSATFGFTDPSDSSVTWRVDWKYLRVLRMSATTWYVVADACDGTRIAGLSRLQAGRTQPEETFIGSYKIPLFLAATIK